MTSDADEDYPTLEIDELAETRSGLHAFARLLGVYTSACAPPRKHWWHSSLQPAVDGFRTGVLRAGGQLFEVVLDFRSLAVGLSIPGLDGQWFPIEGESAMSIKDKLAPELFRGSVSVELDEARLSHQRHDVDPDCAVRLGRVYGHLAQCFARVRSGIAAETSPIQLWPHHFDLAMLVLSGRKIPGQDPEDEEYSDEQLNMGFVPGDEGIGEPYIFVTHYPYAERLEATRLAPGAYFHTQGWSGIVMPYAAFRENKQPEAALIGMLRSAWTVSNA